MLSVVVVAFLFHAGCASVATKSVDVAARVAAQEVGFYQDPASDYGRLSSELFRAVRLVVDTGTRFDIRGFHDEMLNGGVLPLDLLDSRTDSWVRAQKLAPNSARVN
jgi:uncharacterized protein (DUF885 family)